LPGLLTSCHPEPFAMCWSAREEGAAETRPEVLSRAPEEMTGLALPAGRAWALAVSVERRRQGRTR